jgi:GTPase SAR1 family protein
MAIIVVEGPSAAGKTTWCQKHFQKGFAEAAPETLEAPDLFAEPQEVAAFWVEHNIRRWQRALEIEKWESIAVCDGDPLRLYFSWAFWKTGAGDSKLFEIEAALYRKAIEERRIGFADCVVWLEAPIDELRRRAKADATRKRMRLELYLEMIPWMHLA